MMKEKRIIIEKEREVPVIAEADVIIAGGGTAGVAAALSAARNGARTLLIERLFALGGMMSTGLMCNIAIGVKPQGLAKEVIDKLAESGAALPAPRMPHLRIPNDPEGTKSLFDDMTSEAGVKVLFGTMVTDVIKEGNNLKGVFIENVSGRQAVLGKVFIDATGDGSLSVQAGAEYRLGDEKTGLCSAPTLLFRIGNIEFEKLISFIEANYDSRKVAFDAFEENTVPPGLSVRECFYGAPGIPRQHTDFSKFRDVIQKAFAEGKISPWEKDVLTRYGIQMYSMPHPDQVLMNCTRIMKVNGADAEELSDAMVEGRRQAKCIQNFFKRFVPGFENSYVMETGSLMGVRETRRVIGEYYLTMDNPPSTERFPDAIGRTGGPVEIHNPDKPGVTFSAQEGYREIPFRCFIVKGLDNLLVVGRCMSFDQKILSATRSIGTCLNLGETVGTGAALAVRNNVSIRDIPIKKLREMIGFGDEAETQSYKINDSFEGEGGHNFYT
jgi:hypothetical protein